MKRICSFFLTIFLLAHGVMAFASFDPWSTDLETKIKNTFIKNKYSKRLLLPTDDRRPTIAVTGKDNSIILLNILHEGDLYLATIKPEDLESAEILNMPICPGAFHFATLFHFKDRGIRLTSKSKKSIFSKGLVMGTGPEMAFDPRAISGFQLIQMRTCTIEHYTKEGPIEKKLRHRLDTKKVDLELFFLAHAEESSRLAAMTNLRALRGEKPEIGDKVIFQKYNIFGANCVSSGIQNLSRAIRPQFHKELLKMGKKDITEVNTLTSKHFRYFIYSWYTLSRVSLKVILGEKAGTEKFAELEKFHTHLRKTNSMSLPWRAKSIIKWATLD